MSKQPNTITKSYKYFDLQTFEAKVEPKTITFEPAQTLAEATERIGADEATMLKALNAYLRAQVLAVAEKEVAQLGGRKSVVFSVLKPFRALPPWNAIYKMDSSGKPVVEDGNKVIDKKAQTAAILAMVKDAPAIIQAIRDGSAADANEDDSEDEES